ncbi:zinc C2H2 type domain-containing protein [Cryptosporidium andersoni]|uniref:Zinc C2H2 type domain-containing protein n=1 Tax=Cryptosporidium andersoni TaxID=117008 RepID=A0A1J4MEX9_9CRYT|nr:zinc C2H2 type domain-containing protein [Cryptosporidium andersoni]
MQIHVCEECGSAYTNKEIYRRHLAIVHSKKGFSVGNNNGKEAKYPGIYPGSYGAMVSMNKTNSKDINNNNIKKRIDVPRQSIDPYEPKERRISTSLIQGIASQRLAEYVKNTGTKLVSEDPKTISNCPVENLDNKKVAKDKYSRSDILTDIVNSLNLIDLETAKLSQLPYILNLQLEVSMGQLTNWCNQVEKYIEIKRNKSGLFRFKKLGLLNSFENILTQSREFINNTLKPEVKKASAVCAILEQQSKDVEDLRKTANKFLKSGKYSIDEIDTLNIKYKNMCNTFIRKVKVDNKSMIFWNTAIKDVDTQINYLTKSFNEHLEILSKEFSSKVIFTLFLPNPILELE